MKLSFPRWYITGSALVFAKVTRMDSTPFRCRQYVVILEEGIGPNQTQTNQSSYWSLSSTESETSILFTRYHSFLPSLRRKSLYQASELSISEMVTAAQCSLPEKPTDPSNCMINVWPCAHHTLNFQPLMHKALSSFLLSLSHL